MDEYAEYIYQRRPEYRHLSAGDVATQRDLRNKLNCRNFKWFMTEVAWDLPKHYPPVEPPAAAWGEVYLLPSRIFDYSQPLNSQNFSLPKCKNLILSIYGLLPKNVF